MQLSQVPVQIVEAWATSGSKTNPIPVPSQVGITPGAASWTDGFPPLCDTPLISGGIPPSMQDMNGGLFQMSAVDVWMCAGGGFPYNSAFQTAIGGYPKGARVLMASGNGYWVSTVDNNVTDPDTGGAGWASADENAMTALTGDVTATGPGSAAATLASSGVTAGSYTEANITVDAKGRVTAAANGNGLSGFTSGNNANGYWVKDPTGHIRQWSNSVAITGHPSYVPFPISFVTAGSISVQINEIGPDGTFYQIYLDSAAMPTISGFTIAGVSFSGALSLCWTADGY
jgi:hypothetical protein